MCMMNSVIQAIEVSNYFTNKAIEDNKPFTIMEALKFTYIAQGFHLSLEDKPFFEEDVYAWKYGPVIKQVYDILKDKSNSNIIDQLQKLSISKFNDMQKNILSVVFNKYRHLNGWGLSKLTHQQGTPWYETFYNKNKNENVKIIDKKIIQTHFKKIVTQASFVILLSEL